MLTVWNVMNLIQQLQSVNRCAEIKVTMHADCLEYNELDQTTSIGQLVR